MIRLEPQSGRKLVKIYENQECANLFGDDGQNHSGCQVLGEEPNRFTYNTDMQLLIAVFEKGLDYLPQLQHLKSHHNLLKVGCHKIFKNN